MCKLMEDFVNEVIQSERDEWRSEGLREGRSEGLREGRSEGRLHSLKESVLNLRNTLGLSNEQARDALCITPEDWALISGSI